MEHRTFKLENIRAEGDRTVKASISSEYPVKRMNGKKEILVHSPEAVDLSRAPLPLITDHNAQQLNVGVVEDLKIVNKKLKGTLRFGSSSRAMEIWQDVKDGILTGLSVSYEVQETEDAGEYYLVTRWMPLEVSLVSVPADPSVGVGRSFERINQMTDDYYDDVLKQHKTLDKMAPAEIEKYLEGRRQVDAIKASMIEVPGEKVDNRTGGFRSMGETLQAIARYHSGGGMDRRLENRYLSEGSGSAGGFLLQTQYVNEVLQNVWSQGEVLSRVWKIPMRTNTLKIPAIDESSRADGSRSGGVRGYWIDEAAEKQASEPSFRRLELNLNKAVVLIPTTDELLEDAQALEAIIRSTAEKEITFTIENAIINGTGAGRPLGIMNAGGTVTVSKETGQGATIAFENITKMWARLKEDSLKNAVWFINQTVWPELFNMYLAVGTGGSAVYLPGGGLSDAPYGTLMGKPVIPIEYCQALGTAGDIILADPSQYVFAYRELETAMSIHIYFTTDKSVFRFVMRVDGMPKLSAPITPYKGGSSNTLSDFVILETRS